MRKHLVALVVLSSIAGCGAVAPTTPGPDAGADDAGDDAPDAEPPPPPPPECELATDCTDPGLPYCVDGACVACDGNAACDAGAPVCDPVDHECGACVSSDDCAAYPTTPVCGDDGACRTCELDSECASGACNFDTGACYAADQIVLVSLGGSTHATCGTAADPCGSLQAAAPRVSTTRPIVRMTAGTFPGQIVVAGSRPLVVHAAGAQIRADSPSNSTGLFLGTSADITVYDLRVEVLAAAGATYRAIDVNAGTKLVLHRGTVHITGARSTGIETDGTLTVDRSQVSATGLAIGAYGGSVTVTHSQITDSDGMYIAAPNFLIENNIIRNNRGAGVTIDAPVGTTKRIDFNTFLANGSGISSGATELDVVRCDMPAQQRFTGFYNVLSNARPYTGSTGPHLLDGSVLYSVLDQPGATIQFGTNVFAAAALTTDGHLTANSAGIDGITSAGVVDDVDGDPRPFGTGYDMGADEYHP